ncbi:alginate export family protein [Sphingopyxis indica]|uniref:Alginate export n=1 Tax=Sphingopyxis indica TaxID=436663 RepID=A0A239JSW1_9SPHN|nr:alginate export family protein [Sphingopyxis indica]SNT08865.1 Alginate export [Sphingopyxis indica]
MIARSLARVALVGTALFALPAAAQDKASTEPWTLQQALGDPEGLTVSGSARIRYETLSNQFRPGLDKNDDLISLRTSLFAEYDTGPIRIGGELIDARAYDDDPGSSVGTGEVNALELVQAYLGADLGDALGRGTTASLDAGRFVLNLGSRRLVGRNNFRNTTNAFTGAKFEFGGAGKEQLTLFYTYPQQRLPSDKPSILDNEVKWDHEGDDLIFWGGFFNKPKFFGSTNLDLFFYALDEDDRPSRATRDRKLFTPGVRLFRDPAPGAIDYEFEYAYQFGDISASSAAGAAKLDVSAQFLHAELGYQFDGAWKPRLAVEYDLATGDDAGRKFGRFDSLYGPRRFDYGPTGIYGPLGRNNISSPGLRLEVKPDKRWDGFIFYRAAWLDSATDSFASTGVRDATGASSRLGGHQIEARARYWVVPKFLRLDFGGAVLFQGRFLRNAPNSNDFGDTIYSYADLTATF